MFFKKKINKDAKPEQTVPKKQYNLAVLEEKVKNGEAMTSDEYDALQRERAKDVMNKILRIFGVCAMLFVIVLAVGCFLYPYSIFNLFGEGDKFWDCWSHIQFHLEENDINIINTNLYGGADHYIAEVMGNGTKWGWANIADMMQVAFQGTSAKLNFLVLGSWSVVLVATVGIIMVLIFAAYITIYNIKDLIQVIRHFGKQGVNVISDIAATTVESIETGMKDETKEKSVSKDIVIPTVKAGEKDLFSDDDAPSPVSPIEKKVNEVLPPEPTKRRTEAKSELSSEDLDKLLSGESLDA